MLERLYGAVDRRTKNRDEGREGGFTLIELLVVITILGILAAVVVFSVAGVQDKGQSAACQTDSVTIKTAEESYYAKNGNYTDMATLANGNFLSSASTLHTVTPLPAGGPYTSYTVGLAPSSPCTA